jgi:multiple sugar transport system ATP-binding protein
MSALSIKNCTKSYGEVQILKDINLNVKKGEFLTLLGPSGCGKSTLLKIIAGLDTQTSGEILIKGRDVTNVDPTNRNISMVFQSYALYPHMSVYENIATPLKTRKLNVMQKMPFVGKFINNAKETLNDIDKDVKDVAEKLNIIHLLDRKPSELSGGQKQRVAIGRAMVRNPHLFLMDEPLSNLDASLRVQMRTEIAALHRELDETFVYVTHDQEEAMTMSDKVAVMMDGVILQFDTPHNIYTNPNHIKVAQFIGSPKINILNAKALENGKIYLNGKDIEYKLKESEFTELSLGVRPEAFKLVEEKTNKSIKAVIKHIENLGSHYLLYVKIGLEEDICIVKVNDINEHKIDDIINLEIKTKKMLIFDAKSGQRIYGDKNAGK